MHVMLEEEGAILLAPLCLSLCPCQTHKAVCIRAICFCFGLGSFQNHQIVASNLHPVRPASKSGLPLSLSLLLSSPPLISHSPLPLSLCLQDPP